MLIQSLNPAKDFLSHWKLGLLRGQDIARQGHFHLISSWQMHASSLSKVAALPTAITSWPTSVNTPVPQKTVSYSEPSLCSLRQLFLALSTTDMGERLFPLQIQNSHLWSSRLISISPWPHLPPCLIFRNASLQWHVSQTSAPKKNLWQQQEETQLFCL